MLKRVDYHMKFAKINADFVQAFGKKSSHFKVAQYSFLVNGKIGNLIRISGQIILDEKQKSFVLA